MEPRSKTGAPNVAQNIADDVTRVVSEFARVAEAFRRSPALWDLELTPWFDEAEQRAKIDAVNQEPPPDGATLETTFADAIEDLVSQARPDRRDEARAAAPELLQLDRWWIGTELRDLTRVLGTLAVRHGLDSTAAAELAQYLNRARRCVTPEHERLLVRAEVLVEQLRAHPRPRLRTPKHANGTLDERALRLAKQWQLDPAKKDHWGITELADALGTKRANLIGKRKGGIPRCPLTAGYWDEVQIMRAQERVDRGG